MYKGPVFFKKNDTIYEAQVGATIRNRTENVITNVSVREIVDLGNNKYGILLFEAKQGWDKQFEVEGLEDIDI